MISTRPNPDELITPDGKPSRMFFQWIDDATRALNGLALKNNYAGSAAPTVTDDDKSGYSVGSVFVDTTADDGYMCMDATTGAAVWKKITP